MEIIFWFSLAFITFTYAGYPLTLFILSRLFSMPVAKKAVNDPPFVSVVIAAKNEAGRIERRIKNLLEQDYPAEKLEIIVISDGSIDATQSIVEGLAVGLAAGKARITCHANFPSQGKPTALNLGVQVAKGEIIVFADARQLFNPNSVSQLVANFSDPTVGGVSGELIFLENCESNIKAQMGAYWKYEKAIRRMESRSGSVVGATGAIYAIRKTLYQQLPAETVLDDVLTPMNIIMQGHRVVFDGDALAYDTLSKDVENEWRRKVRTLAGNWQIISLQPRLFNPRKNILFFRFFFHKLARILVPFFLIILFFTSIMQGGFLFTIVSSLQILIYTAAFAACCYPSAQRYSIIKFIYFFFSLNCAAIVGFFIWTSGRCSDVWKAGEGKK